MGDKKLAFLGPHANATKSMLSDYFGTSHLVDTNSPLQVAKRAGLSVAYEPGHSLDPASNDTSLIPKAVAAAKASDIAILFVGLCADNCATRVEDEGNDRPDILLPGAQGPLVEAVLSTGVPTIVVLLNTGGPVDISMAKAKASGVMHSFYPGEFGGDAIINTLLGVSNPSGRLPYTMYPNTMTKNRKVTDMDLRSVEGVTYKWYTGHISGPPVFEFGFGLSYTTFKVEWGDQRHLALHQLAASEPDAKLEYCVNVTNTGQRRGAFSVLGFVNGDGSVRPFKSLFAFEKVMLEPAESQSVILTTTVAKAFAAIDESGRKTLSPGHYTVSIGDHSLETTSVLTGPPNVLAEYPLSESKPQLHPTMFV